MDEQLLGYVLNALDPDERIEVESYLHTQPEGQEQLDLARQALEPLAVDNDSIEPPPDLWVRTLARIAEHTCRALPVAAPLSPAARSPAPSWTWWRRADILVAASILTFLMVLIPPGVAQIRFRAAITSCQNNLRTFYYALQTYSDQHHGSFPDVASAAPRYDVAGIFVPMLNQNKLLPDNVSVACPANGHQPPSPLTFEDVKKMDVEEFRRHIQSFAGCYAYSLGYNDGSAVHGLRLIPGDPMNVSLPILADRPPTGVASGDPGNSPNHGGLGQNVLFIDGHCGFRTLRTVGFEGDDIYVNFDHKVAAGKTRWDSVLASSDCKP